LGLEPSLEVGRKEKLGELASQFVELLFHLIKPHTVALFLPTERDLRLVAIKSLERDVVPPGYRVSLSDTFIPTILEEIGEIWIRELSEQIHRIVPIYPGETAIHSMRIIPVPIDMDNTLPLLIDYTDSPESDPLDTIEPLIDLFSHSVTWTKQDLFLKRGPIVIPIPVFLRRILTLFIDFNLAAIPVESLGLVLWGPPASEGEILEVYGERITGTCESRERYFNLGPFRFWWSMGGLRKLSSPDKETEESAQYYPLIVGGDVVGNLSIVSNTPGFEFEETMVRLISWSIQRELKLMRELIGGTGGIGLPNSNPYRAVNRVLDEWSNASRYNEYLSLGLVDLQIEGLDAGPERWCDIDRVDSFLWSEVEGILRTGDILAHCSKGKMAFIFPRTSPEGAENALRRLRNLLEGKKFSVNGGSVRIESAKYTVLCYPQDLPTKDIVLEKCSLVFLPG
jgi:hypothetical protein